MKTYLVGGAVRDHLLGYPVTERDWVVRLSNTRGEVNIESVETSRRYVFEQLSAPVQESVSVVPRPVASSAGETEAGAAGAASTLVKFRTSE